MAEFTQSNDVIPAGTIMIFGQNNAPIGWTQETAWEDGAMLCFIQDGDTTSSGTIDIREEIGHSDDFTTDNENTHTHTNTLTTNDEAAHTHTNSLSTDTTSHTHIDIISIDNESTHTHSDDFAVADESSHTHDIPAGSLSERSGTESNYSFGAVVASSSHIFSAAVSAGSAHSHGISGSVGTGTAHSHGITGDDTESGDHSHGISGNVGAPDAAHNHSISGNVGVPDAVHNHGMSGSIDNHSVPKYQEVIAASKD